MTPPLAIGDDQKAQLDVIAELAKKLKGTTEKQLKTAIKAINYEARTDRHRVYVDGVTTVFASLVSGCLVVAYLWVGYEMVKRDHVIPCVLLCGIPATSIASIFSLKKALGSDVLGKLAQVPWRYNGPAAQNAPAPAAAPAPDPAAPAAAPDATVPAQAAAPDAAPGAGAADSATGPAQ
ncbi:hypothetical protein [Streptomyces sp. NPDC006193]|uniref:hypothetical protein n=1 Tax=Streptomyces sp. NPDC006193 TaxID=3155717 RepID=UPI0033BDF51A